MENKEKIDKRTAEADNKRRRANSSSPNRQNEPTKKHGDKDSESAHNRENEDASKGSHLLEDEKRFGLDAEMVDPNDTDTDYLSQPQPMSDQLRSIYPGAPGKNDGKANAGEQKATDQNRDAGERRNNFGQAGYDAGEKNEDQGDFLDTERGNYSKHNDYQDRQGRQKDLDLEEEFPHEERNRFPSSPAGNKDNEASNITNRDDKNQKRNATGEETPAFSSGLQNDWDENAVNPKSYGETDYDDRDVRRRQDEGQQPWDESDKEEDNV